MKVTREEPPKPSWDVRVVPHWAVGKQVVMVPCGLVAVIEDGDKYIAHSKRRGSVVCPRHWPHSMCTATVYHGWLAKVFMQ
jgi:hypothetical protein